MLGANVYIVLLCEKVIDLSTHVETWYMCLKKVHPFNYHL